MKHTILLCALLVAGCGEAPQDAYSRGRKEALSEVAHTDYCKRTACIMVCTWSDGNQMVFPQKDCDALQLTWRKENPQ